ncbi:MAG: tetratricopeptide (TPR) repeat protein [Hydrogenophaga sp.]|jgi:tetratricopeptide (TPR) repeat protein
MALGLHSAVLNLSLAVCRLRLEQPALALRSLDQALALDATLAEAWSMRGNLMRETVQLLDAARCFERALANGGDEALHRATTWRRCGPASPCRRTRRAPTSSRCLTITRLISSITCCKT